MMGSNEAQIRISSMRTMNPVRVLTATDLLSFNEIPKDKKITLPIKELLVEGLLSFGKKTLFEFGRLNILVGPNGAGKSNLIDCIRILRYSPLDIQETFKDAGFEEWLYRGENSHSGRAFLQVMANLPVIQVCVVHQIRLGPPQNSRAPLEEVISDSRAQNEGLDPYFVGSYRSEAVLSAVGSGKRRRKRSLGANEYDPFQSILSQIRDIEQYPEITRLSSLYSGFRIYSEWTFGRTSNLRESTPANRSNTTLSELMNDLPLVLNGMEKTTAHNKIRDLLGELKETYVDYTTRILFGRVGLELQEAPFEIPLPARRLSDGTLRFLALAAILLQPDPPPLICLEEPELGMHPDMIRMVATMIAEASTRTQLVITTHSEHLLSSLQSDFDVLFAFDAHIEGTTVRRFSQEDFQDWRESHSLGELWTSGELGGNRW